MTYDETTEVTEIIEQLMEDNLAGRITHMVVGLRMDGDLFFARSTFPENRLADVLDTMGDMIADISPRNLQ